MGWGVARDPLVLCTEAVDEVVREPRQSFSYTVLVGFSVSFRAYENKGCPKHPFHFQVFFLNEGACKLFYLRYAYQNVLLKCKLLGAMSAGQKLVLLLALLCPSPSPPPALHCPGREAYNQEQWWYVREWMLEALRKADEEENMDEIDLTGIYDHLAYAEYQVSA